VSPTIKVFITLLTITLFAISANAKADDFEIKKERAVDQLLGSDVRDEEVQDILDIMNEDGSFQGIDYEDLSREAGFPHVGHTRNLVSLFFLI